MMSILDEIVARKRQEIAERQSACPLSLLEQRLSDAPAVRDFRAALHHPGEVRIIAEVKKASPSAGELRKEFDPVAIADIYAAHGASAISVLTDEHFFRGKLSYLLDIRRANSLPLLRKDFILSPYQVLEARIAGADAVLLIAEIISDKVLAELVDYAHELNMHALVELYEPGNLSRVVGAGAKLIGINNRDLRTFQTRLEHTLEIAEKIPKECTIVSESGIRSREDILTLQAAGVNAVLIGETLMRAGDIGAKLDELTGL